MWQIKASFGGEKKNFCRFLQTVQALEMYTTVDDTSQGAEKWVLYFCPRLWGEGEKQTKKKQPTK